MADAPAHPDSVAPPPDPADQDTDPITIAFRERYKLLERAIPHLFRPADGHPCCPRPDDDFNFDALGQGDVEMIDADAAEAPRVAHPLPVKIRVEDEDYDFDEEEDEEEGNDVVKQNETTSQQSQILLQTGAPPPPVIGNGVSSLSGSSSSSMDGGTSAAAAAGSSQPATATTTSGAQAHLPSAEDAKVTREKIEADRKAAEDAARAAIKTMYFTLENDRDAMLEQQKLEESDRQVAAESNAAINGENGGGGNQPGRLASTNLGASNLTLKHLIARIDAKRERVKISDMELRNLMSEVRKNRSKWASEDKIGQEELYEAAEKVVLELRANTEHSTAFLNRVNKREAPDYYQIIKQPMDLGTVMKKLKQHAYKSKKEFVEDLNLIWANCLKYNADPSHFLRKHAKAMQKLTAGLVPLIPEITIKDRVELEREEAAQAEADAEGESDDEPIMSSRGRKGPGSKKSRKGAQPSTSTSKATAKREGTPDSKPPLVNLIRADSNPPNDTQSQSLGINGFPTPTGGTPQPNGLSNHITQLELEDDDTGDAEYQTWKKITKKGRAKVASQRNKLFRGTKLNPEEPALLRSRKGMARRIKEEIHHLTGLDEPEEHEALPGVDGEDDEDQMSQLPDFYDMPSSAPELPWRTVWASDSADPEISDPTNTLTRLAPSGLFTQPPSNLSSAMNSNLKKMQDTRKVCSKISVIKQMQIQTQIYANQFTKYDPKPFIELDAEPFVITTLPSEPIHCASTARAALQRSIGKLFYHAGFEEFQPSALEAATDIAADYFQKIAKTLMVYAEAPQHDRKFTAEEMILHALYENGADVESLNSYVRDDIERLGTKLSTIHERMKSYLAELLRPALADSTGEEKIYNDGSEVFVGGDFSEDIGEDFFGFKELGLDKEFSLSSLSVPLHLLQGRMHNAYQPTNAASSAASNEPHPVPPPFEPVTREVAMRQVGLVRGWFLGRLEGLEEDASLVEDEDLPLKQRPPKPRLPPTGKIDKPRKRPIVGQGAGSKKKKKVEKKGEREVVKEVKIERTESVVGKEEEGMGMISPESIAA